MANVLEKIVENKRIEIAALKQQKPLASFIDELTPTKKDMYAALDRKQGHRHAGFILECKKASPSKGLIRPDFDVKAICQIYDKYAAAISVLTDEKYFQGKFEYLKIVTDTVSCPVLNKDFFVDAYQVYLARYYGADAILLMLSVLSDEEYQELSRIAQQYNLAVLTEVSNEEERDRAISLGAKLVGINNRNLRDLSTNIATTFDFAPTLPDDCIVISESGIYTNDQVRELAPAVDGFLVGSSIMAQDDIDLACRTLIYGNNKVCGLTSPEYAAIAKDSGAQFGGLIFAEKSPRFVTKAIAEQIVTAITGLRYVGVYVNHPTEFVAETALALNLYAVQLHGQEDEQYIETLREQLPKSCQIWKAVAVDSTVPRLDLLVQHYVLDGKSAGSGQSFNWQVLADSEQDLSPCFLAGGLNIDNIATATQLLTTQELYGLDLNSGVESSPGIKSRDKLNKVFAQIRNY
ncbi:bifunctional indole-3-glycerol-phosphate synthase TrpC/phosphoribosylanthranilate isomerase TrpF [Thalassotalea profundi]|uniref:Multifunctional fusion protein n=1 Tax=Thalassotalea profundi TaxID=2036687 RepID=A0ABQ3ICH0_9GAMM|nr:bifunctional indole-3-glycerol-phosphate synthase TrpC/phosphoribosylanthranilate isomerase TrpF [Thalassotalea profundi]GHE79156.1 bifunctional indole-3-glycerol phosphate synthase/phosphoribosylanthranilate isomerase [Thalassotalea profundi]